jgi:hypothetical protein
MISENADPINEDTTYNEVVIMEQEDEIDVEVAKMRFTEDNEETEEYQIDKSTVQKDTESIEDNRWILVKIIDSGAQQLIKTSKDTEEAPICLYLDKLSEIMKITTEYISVKVDNEEISWDEPIGNFNQKH